MRAPRSWRRAPGTLVHHARRRFSARIVRDTEEYAGRFAAARARSHGADDLRSLLLRSSRGAALRGLGRFAEAEAEFADVVARMTATLGADHRHTLDTRAHHAAALRDLGRFGEAEAEFREVITALTACHADTARLRAWHAVTLQDLGRFGESEAELRQLIEAEPAARARRR